MADKKISQLTAAATPLAGTEVFPIVQSGTTVKATIANVQSAPVDAGTANGVQYLNGSKVPATGAAFNYDGTTVQNTKAGNSATALFNATNSDSGNIARAAYSFNADTGSGSIGVVSSAWNVDALPVNSTYIYGSHGVGLLPASGQNVNLYVGNLVVGTADKGIEFSGGLIWRTGTGTPEGAVTAPVGSLFTRTDGGANTTLYVKESGAGNTGWVAK